MSTTEETLIPVRESWEPAIIYGYLPVPVSFLEELAEKKRSLLISYPVDEAPPGTSLSFVLTNLWPEDTTSTIGEISLCAYQYPLEMIERINGYQENWEIMGTLH